MQCVVYGVWLRCEVLVCMMYAVRREILVCMVCGVNGMWGIEVCGAVMHFLFLFTAARMD